MSLALFAHPFSSYCQKVLIALYADGTPFEYRLLEQDHPENFAELKRHWPFAKFPMLLDDGEPLIETTPIIEYLYAHYRGPNDWIPAGEMEQRVRFLDRFFDLYIMENMSKISTDPLRPEGSRDVYGVEKARANLNLAYDWIEGQLGAPGGVGENSPPPAGAAPPSFFSADGVEPIGARPPQLSEYRAGLLPPPAVARAVDEGRPYRHY